MLRVTTTATGCTAPASYEVVTDPVTYLKSAYEAIDSFVIDIVFEGKYEVITPGAVDPVTGVTGADTITYVYLNAVDVTSTYDWASKGIEYSKPNAYTVRLTGPAETVFTDQFYEFKMADYTTQRLQPTTTLPFFSLTHYSMPNPTYTMLAYPFTVKRSATSTLSYVNGVPVTVDETHTMNQWFFWSYYVAINNIASLRTRGLK